MWWQVCGSDAERCIKRILRILPRSLSPVGGSMDSGTALFPALPQIRLPAMPLVCPPPLSPVRLGNEIYILIYEARNKIHAVHTSSLCINSSQQSAFPSIPRWTNFHPSRPTQYSRHACDSRLTQNFHSTRHPKFWFAKSDQFKIPSHLSTSGTRMQLGIKLSCSRHKARVHPVVLALPRWRQKDQKPKLCFPGQFT